jgi:hypothetical protein
MTGILYIFFVFIFAAATGFIRGFYSITMKARKDHALLLIHYTEMKKWTRSH